MPSVGSLDNSFRHNLHQFFVQSLVQLDQLFVLGLQGLVFVPNLFLKVISIRSKFDMGFGGFNLDILGEFLCVRRNSTSFCKVLLVQRLDLVFFCRLPLELELHKFYIIPQGLILSLELLGRDF